MTRLIYIILSRCDGLCIPTSFTLLTITVRGVSNNLCLLPFFIPCPLEVLLYRLSRIMRKPVLGLGFSDQAQHKPGCTTKEDGKRLEISDLGSRGIVLCSKSKGADKLHGYHAADPHLCFCICKKQVFS